MNTTIQAVFSTDQILTILTIRTSYIQEIAEYKLQGEE